MCGVRQGGVLFPLLFSVYIADLIKNLRQSGHGVYIGNLFVGCILYADIIVLLSSSCNGLQSMIDICGDYGKQFDIRFNPLNSQTSCFGGSPPSHFCLVLNGMTIPMTEKNKCIVVYINSKTNSTDPAITLINFFGSFNNIMSVLGTARDELIC